MAAGPAAGEVRQKVVQPGRWCFAGTERGAEQYVQSDRCGVDAWLEIAPDHYDAHEQGCRFVSIATWFDPNMPANTKELGVPVARIVAQCGGEGCTWRTSFVMYVSKAVLFMKDRKIFRNTCRG
jgi:hypothetical protein